MQKICAWLCGRHAEPPRPAPEIPDELREASHRSAIAAANLQGIALKITQADDIGELVRTMQGGRRR